MACRPPSGQTLDTGIHELIRDLRLGLARNLIINTRQSITDITYECGFCHHGHFRNLFSRKYGITPKKLRNERRDDGAEDLSSMGGGRRVLR
ncbi:helix-turn-helix transcriptional regulator [Aestuariispira ectoiniformans]|uniref:helix-turn-helix transcriptional regulator n=1 Tax=Aestuariispira ectoiniformans TaxID=2775080 RepID=UPI0035CCD56C